MWGSTWGIKVNSVSYHIPDHTNRKAKKEHGASIVFLPEAFDFIGESGAQTKELAEPLDGPTVSKYQQLAKELDLEVSLGGFHEATTGLKSTTQIVLFTFSW